MCETNRPPARRMLETAVKSAFLHYPTDSVRWNYENGLMLHSLLEVSGAHFGHAWDGEVRRRLDAALEPDGAIKGYRVSEYNVDQINMGRVALDFLRFGEDPRYRRVVDTLLSQLEGQPRTPSGSFWHKKIYPDQVWLDGLYMFGPFMAGCAVRSGKRGLLDDLSAQIGRVRATMRDEGTGLYYHGRDESRKMPWADPATGCSPHIWGRAVGWLAMALLDILDMLREAPEGGAYAESIAGMLRDLAEAIVRCQQPSGLWYQVMDRPDEEGNYPEASASCMNAYFLMKASREGHLPGNGFRAAGARAIRSVWDRLVETDEYGDIHLGGICKVAGLGGTPYRDGSFEYYIGEPIARDDFKGFGPFVLALGELAAFQ